MALRMVRFLNVRCPIGAGAQSGDRGINISALPCARIYAAKALDEATRITLDSGSGRKLLACLPGEGQGDRGRLPLRVWAEPGRTAQ